MTTTRENHDDKGTEAHIANFELPEVNRREAQKKLVEWLATSKKFQHHAQFHYHVGHEDHFTDDHVRGLVATKDIKKGEIVNVIGNEHILSTSSFAAELASKKVEIPSKDNDGKSYTPLYRVMMYLLTQAQNPTSKWRPYIDALPREVDYTNFLVNWSSSELMMLDDDAVLMEASRKWNDVHRKFDSLPAKYKQKWPWHAWLWSYYVVSTRVFSCKYRMCVVPLADNYNTADDTKMNTIWHFDKKTNDFHIKATVDIKKDEEIFTKYGNHDNRHYLAHYGFVMPLNNADLLTFRFTIDSDKKGDVKRKTKSKTNPCQVSQGNLYCSVKRKDVKAGFDKMVTVAKAAVGAKPKALKQIIEQAEFYRKEHDGSTLRDYKRSGLGASNEDRMDIIERFHDGYFHIAEEVKQMAEKALDG